MKRVFHNTSNRILKNKKYFHKPQVSNDKYSRSLTNKVQNLVLRILLGKMFPVDIAFASSRHPFSLESTYFKGVYLPCASVVGDLKRR